MTSRSKLDETREALRRHRFTRLKTAVLPHVREIRRDQSDLSRAERPRGISREDKAQEAVIRPCECADQIGRLTCNVGEDTDVGLAIRKLTRLYCSELPMPASCQMLPKGFVAR